MIEPPGDENLNRYSPPECTGVRLARFRFRLKWILEKESITDIKSK